MNPEMTLKKTGRVNAKQRFSIRVIPILLFPIFSISNKGSTPFLSRHVPHLLAHPHRPAAGQR
jgi:hypothetical protein